MTRWVDLWSVTTWIARWLALGALVALPACVGSADSESAGGRAEDRVPPDPSAAARWDSVQPVPYHLFERLYSADDSSRLLARFLVLGEHRPEALSRTLLVALDSIGKADSSLMAARAILYTASAMRGNRATLVPSVWAEWVPPEGWERAGPRDRRTIHRTFVYHVDPGWWSSSQVEEATEHE